MGDIEAVIGEYRVNEQGQILNPGSFEGEQLYVPYYWEVYLDGGADDDDGDTLMFKVTDEDVEEFPELEGREFVFLRELDSGFVIEVAGSCCT